MIDSDARGRIEAAIRTAEAGTRAEFVAVIAHRADDYAETGYLAGLAAGALAGIAAWRLVPWVGGGEILTAFFAAFLIVFAAMRFTSLGVRLTPRSRRERAARRLARLAFLERGLAATDEHCGVLFFVAAAERYVEIIADRGIDRKVEAAAWQRIVDGFTAAVREGRVEAGFLGAVAGLAGILAQHYPPDGSNPNEIADRLIEI